MKQVQTDKYTIAWFKIADCLSRGEKERALGVYRLLSHSFNDDALAMQLEADIYLSCNEHTRAIELYRSAIELYVKAERFLEAAAVSEHLVMFFPTDKNLYDALFSYYIKLHNDAKVCAYFKLFIQHCDPKNDQLVVLRALERAIDFFAKKKSHNGMKAFLETVSKIDKDLYDYAYDYSKK
jgi:hypothetical protein